MSQYNPDNHHRHSIRLKGYDYDQAGAYFVTICTRGRECLLGEVTDGQVQLSECGTIVQQVWQDLPNHYPHVQPDAWVIMPNHVHGIIILTDSAVADPVVATLVGAGLRPAPTGPAPTTGPPRRHGLPEVVRALKSFSARRINQLRSTPGTRVWQRNYYEHIVRSERALDAIREYVHHNPVRWELDRYNPSAVGRDPQAAALWALLKEDSARPHGQT